MHSFPLLLLPNSNHADRTEGKEEKKKFADVSQYFFFLFNHPSKQSCRFEYHGVFCNPWFFPFRFSFEKSCSCGQQSRIRTSFLLKKEIFLCVCVCSFIPWRPNFRIFFFLISTNPDSEVWQPLQLTTILKNANCRVFNELITSQHPTVPRLV